MICAYPDIDVPPLRYTHEGISLTGGLQYKEEVSSFSMRSSSQKIKGIFPARSTESELALCCECL
ncbi:MAG: hypothetical protein HOK72_02475 [Flavobacteriales bacterium]|nr:hypothetical protein [Flavobacteriales bacterium]